jgi:hypothetical protein
MSFFEILFLGDLGTCLQNLIPTRGVMPYLSNSGQLGEFWTTSLAWRSGDLLMPRGLILINNIVYNKYYMFQEIS